MECSGVLPTTKFAYRKGLGTCDALLCVSHTLQSALEHGQEARMVRIDFSAAFDMVKHLGILYKLCSVGIGNSVLSILTQFQSNRSQQVMVDGCRSKLVTLHQECCRAVFWARYYSSCTLRSFFSILKNKLIGYADFNGCCAIPRHQSCSSRVPDPCPWQG